MRTLVPLNVDNQFSAEKLEANLEELRRDVELMKQKEAGRVAKEEAAPSPKSPQVSVQDAGDFLKLENIVCTGADGKPFEQYDELYIAKDIFREQNGWIKSFTPYQAIAHSEQHGLFLPSFALSCNILVALFNQRNNNHEVAKVLQQYNNYGSYCRWHAQNTIVDWGKQEIIHYPEDADFPSYGGTKKVNKGERNPLGFQRKKLKDCSLEEALQQGREFQTYLKNLTGLSDPAQLIPLGDAWKKPAYVWVSSLHEVRAAWLGCMSSFYLSVDYFLGDIYEARGVRRRATAGSVSSP